MGWCIMSTHNNRNITKVYYLEVIRLHAMPCAEKDRICGQRKICSPSFASNSDFCGQTQDSCASPVYIFSQHGSSWFLPFPRAEENYERDLILVTRSQYAKHDSPAVLLSPIRSSSNFNNGRNTLRRITPMYITYVGSFMLVTWYPKWPLIHLNSQHDIFTCSLPVNSSI